MYNLLFMLCSVCFLACTNSSTTADNNKDAATTNKALGTATILSRESELVILDDCIDNARQNLTEERAYALCKCVLTQVQQKHPNADSAALVSHLGDTTEVAAMVKQCQ